MLIKTTALNIHLQRPLLPVYLLYGTDDYFLQETRVSIARAWRNQALTTTDADSIEKQSLEMGQDKKNWLNFAAQLQSLNLFAEKTLYLVRYAKSSVDATMRTTLIDFAESDNHHASIIISSNQLKANSLKALEKHSKIGIIPVWPLKPNEFLHWTNQLINQSFPGSTRQIGTLVAQHCQNNPYAVRQIMAKLKLVQTESEPLQEETVLQQLSNQCEFQVFEISDACLEGNPHKVLQILNYLKSNPKELTLLLWVISKDIRTLSQLTFLEQQMAFGQACQQLNIWRNKTALYQAAARRNKQIHFNRLINFCQHADVLLKTGQVNLARQLIEQLTLSVTLGKEMVING